jgi:hypothetical protein
MKLVSRILLVRSLTLKLWLMHLFDETISLDETFIESEGQYADTESIGGPTVWRGMAIAIPKISLEIQGSDFGPGGGYSVFFGQSFLKFIAIPEKITSTRH